MKAHEKKAIRRASELYYTALTLDDGLPDDDRKEITRQLPYRAVILAEMRAGRAYDDATTAVEYAKQCITILNTFGACGPARKGEEES